MQQMKQQRGGTILGFVAGVVVGLGAALAVAVYVTKVPIPFVDRGPTRSADQDVVESQKNKDWDPNAPLYGKNPAKPGAGASVPDTAPADAPAELSKDEIKPAVTADPLGDLATARARADGADPFRYFVQVGAYRTAEDAESQRARLSLSGVEAKIFERDQAGRTVFRVRVGPFERRDEADQTKERLDAAGLETALVRVQR
jgi:cell division protein FtsN